MAPNDPNDETPHALTPRGSTAPQPRERGDTSSPAQNTNAQREAAANVTRSQISRIYERDSPYKDFDQTTNPYERTHASVPSEQSNVSTTEHFRKYHTAWQDYYQKYYESYYTQAVRQTQETLKIKAQMENAGTSAPVYSANAKPGSVTNDSAVKELQNSLRHRITAHAGRVRKSRHFWPLITAACVAGVFLFLQYNRLMVANVAAYVSPGSVDPQNIIVDPSTDTKVGPDPKIIIPKINVDAPVIYTVPTMDNDTIEANLKNGTVHYPIAGANAFPGQKGNNVIGGHSSNDVFDDGKYKFVFVQLEKLVVGDTIYLNYQGTRYTYHIVKTQTIEPTEITELTAYTDKPYVTLVTCTPIGTALHRFIVVAEQVSPDPSGAANQNVAGSANDTSIPGNAPTLLERLFQ